MTTNKNELVAGSFYTEGEIREREKRFKRAKDVGSFMTDEQRMKRYQADSDTRLAFYKSQREEEIRLYGRPLKRHGKKVRIYPGDGH